MFTVVKNRGSLFVSIAGGDGTGEEILESYLSGLQKKYLNTGFGIGFALLAFLTGYYLWDRERVDLFWDILILLPIIPIYAYYIWSGDCDRTAMWLLSGLLLSLFPGFLAGGFRPLGIAYTMALPNLIVYLLPFRKGRFFLLLYLIFLSFLFFTVFFEAVPFSYSRPVMEVVIFCGVVLAFFSYSISLRQEKLTRDMSDYVFHDRSTSYYNRNRLLKDLENRSRKTLILINVDNFKEINDILGNRTGDRIIGAVGQVLQKNICNDGIYRLSGSEFALLIFLPQSGGEGEEGRIIQVIQSILYDVSRIHLQEGDINIPVGVSMGVASDEGIRGSGLLNCADLALQEGKLSKSKFSFYDSSMKSQSELLMAMKWDEQVENAFEDNRILPYFQPIYDNGTGKVTKYECLVRMIDQSGTVHGPEEFLEIVQKKKLYHRLTRTVFRQGVQAVREWGVPISINICEEDVRDPFTREYIFLLLEQNNVGHLIQFEILESREIRDLEALNVFLERVRRFGCEVALDDFGSGYCNFDYLTAIRTDYVKIDGTLIQEIDKSREKRLLVENIVSITRELNIRTVAEHVNTREVLEIVKDLGVTCSQGFYLGKPAPFGSLRSGKVNPSSFPLSAVVRRG